MRKSNRHLGIVNPDKGLDLSPLYERDKNKVSLRIDHMTVILVDKKNATKQYAEKYKKLIKKMGEDKYLRTISVAFIVALSSIATRIMRIDTAVSVIFLIAMIIIFIQLIIDINKNNKNNNGKKE